ncbi:MAG: hypothetical protein R3C54_05530 [Parvularculaceae bacterium]
MSAIPCTFENSERQQKVDEYVEALKLEAHKIGSHGLSEDEFYESGSFVPSSERIRGQNSATMREKRSFVQHVLSILQERGYIKEWEAAGNQNRYDYDIVFEDGKRAAIELKDAWMETTQRFSNALPMRKNLSFGAYARIDFPIWTTMHGLASTRG